MGEWAASVCLGLIKAEDRMPLNMWEGLECRLNLVSGYFCPLDGKVSCTASMIKKRNDICLKSTGYISAEAGHLLTFSP